MASGKNTFKNKGMKENIEINVHRNMYVYDIKYYHTRYGWITQNHVFWNIFSCFAANSLNFYAIYVGISYYHAVKYYKLYRTDR